MTDITTEKARIGAPSAQPFINGFTEEGESLSPINSAGSKAPLAGEASSATPTAAASASRTAHAPAA
ncbi:protein involved in iron-sulfur cluster assembly [Arthrobacter sp. Hiyo6]|nr:protein involved in iron-sulfur cluster assembly [Arthrobacter sp. Hiyo6]